MLFMAKITCGFPSRTRGSALDLKPQTGFRSIYR